MKTLKARFDGRVLVPEHPVDLPVDEILEIQIADVPQNGSVENGGAATNNEDASGEKSLFEELMEISQKFPANPDTPTDLAAQHDHYLHGMPKRP